MVRNCEMIRPVFTRHHGRKGRGGSWPHRSLTINHKDPSQPFPHGRSPRHGTSEPNTASGCVRNDLPQTVEYIGQNNLLSISRRIQTPAISNINYTEQSPCWEADSSNSQQFMEAGGSLRYSQQPATRPTPKSDPAHATTLLLQDPF